MESRIRKAEMAGAVLLVVAALAGAAAGLFRASSPLEIRGDLRLPVNQANESELSLLPGVGPALAAKLVAGRPYAREEDLQRVKGIGPVTAGKIAPYLRFDPPSFPPDSSVVP